MRRDELHRIFSLAETLLSRFIIHKILYSDAPPAPVVYAVTDEEPSSVLAAARDAAYPSQIEVVAGRESAMHIPPTSTMLWGNPTINMSSSKTLTHLLLITYDTAGLATKDKIRLYQRLHGIRKSGGTTKKNYTYPGIIELTSAARVGKSAVMAPPQHEQVYRDLFASFGAPSTMISIYREHDSRGGEEKDNTRKNL